MALNQTITQIHYTNLNALDTNQPNRIFTMPFLISGTADADPLNIIFDLSVIDKDQYIYITTLNFHTSATEDVEYLKIITFLADWSHYTVSKTSGQYNEYDVPLYNGKTGQSLKCTGLAPLNLYLGKRNPLSSQLNKLYAVYSSNENGKTYHGSLNGLLYESIPIHLLEYSNI